MYEISDRDIDRLYGEYERPVRWPYRDEELDDFENTGREDDA